MKNNKSKKWIYWLGVLVVLFVAIQLYPYPKPKVVKNNPNDFLMNTKMPKHVASMFEHSCYDCHSNQTKYPWYAHIAPSSWLLASDVKEGREHLNFSDWTKMNKLQQVAALSDIANEVASGDMPFFLYPIMHKDARMTEADRKEMVDWAKKYQNELFNSK
jgi:hypothetical protein